MGFKKKVLRIDFTNTNDVNDYESMTLLNNPTYEELEDRLNKLLAEHYDTYLHRTKEYAAYVMNYNPELPPHEFIREKIKTFLEVV